jgi:galactose mutarotase-like enzyme
MDDFHFADGLLTARVESEGAQLCSLAHAQFGEMLWQAGPAWPQHAPNLFPIVGQLAGDTLRSNGATYTLTRHGFARRRRFAWLERSAAACRLELRDDEDTRASYPFAFRLEIGFALDANVLTATYTIENPGAVVLPASVGAHPAFRWPLADGIPKPAHRLEFGAAEPAPIRRLQDGLLELEAFPSPIKGRTLALDDALFAADAIVMDQLASRSLRYSAPAAPAIEVRWERFRELGLWSKPGSEFLCIEPWYGYASPVDFDGPFAKKPGLLLIPPGGSEVLALHIAVHGPD